MNSDERIRRWLVDHAGLVWKVVRAFASPADRDDLFQEIVVQLWTSAARFRGQSKESTWIYRVAFNTALAWRRQTRRRDTRFVTGLSLASLEGANSSRDDAARERDAKIERLYAAIRALPEVDASLALMHLDGLSYLEMAEVLGLTENHIGVKLTRVRKKLADALRNDDHDD